jgi:hypothetical protein
VPFTLDAIPLWLWWPIGLGILIGAAATILPMRAGAKALRGMEF